LRIVPRHTRGRAINNQEVIIGGELWKLSVQGRLRQTDNGEKRIALSAGRPIKGAPLRVGIYHHHSFALLRERSGEMHGKGCFPTPPFDLRMKLSLRFYGFKDLRFRG
jgi:hypothetical protein